MRSLVLVVTLVVSQAGAAESFCYIGNCRASECNGTRCTRCKDDFYLDTSSKTWRDYCHACPSRCSGCDGNEDCSECIAGRYGYQCQFNCTFCCKDDICDKNSGACTNGFHNGWYQKTNNICSQCPSRCSQCSSTDSCSACTKVNYWGTRCQYTCEHCSICGQYGCSSPCDSGFYRSYSHAKLVYECIQCPVTCKLCNAVNNCQTCKTGYWGTVCQHTCGNCASCSKTSGCSICNTGYYRVYSNSLRGGICYQCREACTSCTSYITCDSCSQKYWGTTCSNSCPNSCELCTSNTACSACVAGYWGSFCQYSCSRCYGNVCSKTQGCTSGCIHGYYLEKSGNENQCKKCLDVCTTCSDGISCNSCPSGFVGPQCQHDCRASNGACNIECDTGWFGERCDMTCNVTNCQTCSNEDQNICMYCADGFYQQTNASCITCPLHCLAGTMCNKHNGSCSDGCVANWSGVMCDIPCPSGCRQCDKLNKSSCSLCKEEFYGDSCEKKCKSGCVTKDQSQTCDKSNGTCNFDCKDELWGDQCDKQCGKGCSGNACNKTTGNCLSKCYDTHFGQMCDSQCSENCVPSTERSCYEIDGFCQNGCQNGWFGRQCNDHCGENCKGKICDRNNGFCIAGCIDGFKGSMCAQALRSEISSGSNKTTIGGGIGAAVAVLVIAALIVVIVIQRRRLTRANDSREHAANVVATDSQATDETNLKPTPDYQNLAIGTTCSTDQHAHDSIECTPIYQELDKETREGTEYSTVDEITPT